MEKFKGSFCRLCLNNENDASFKIIDETIKEVLDILLPKLWVEENNSIICNVCCTKLFAAFHFKAICMDTEDIIFPYISSKDTASVDLREVYLKEKDKEQLGNILQDEKICRLCMQIVSCGFTSVKEVKADVFLNYIPQVNFISTKDPVICSICLDSLSTHSSFLKDCSDIQEQIRNVSDEREIFFYIKNEQIEIKSEQIEDG
ncbi:uncharacterized protein LOC111692401 [Anoplophora glabripennis]|nr:uncharacterized protein LOC111692401 [Anoplophora glabripennis]